MCANDVVFKRKIAGERPLIMLPLNVVMVGRIRGAVNPAEVTVLLERLKLRHPFLAVRVQYDENGAGSYVSSDVPAITTHVEQRHSDDQWINRVKEELRMPFPIETGPLVRCAVIQSANVSEIILVGNHAICDGMSLGYLLRDLLKGLADPDHVPDILIEPPPINEETVPNPKSANPLVRFIIGRINARWGRKNIRFSESDMFQMHDAFWSCNSSLQVIAWSMNPEETDRLQERCRAESVTVNTALWTALLAAQYHCQEDRLPYRHRSGLAVNIRNKLKVSAGEAFGFFASSLTVKLPYNPGKSFWENARNIHLRINKALAKTNLFRMVEAEVLHPTLIDSLYFRKYGMLDEALPYKLLRKMNWHKITYGCSLTNVGKFEIPTSYGPYHLEAVYGPLVYSDVNEKVVGVITVGGSLSFIIASNESIVGDATRIKKALMEYLKEAVNAY